MAFLAIAVVSLPIQSHAGLFFWKDKKPVALYGIEKNVYDSLTDEQQKHIIEVYNGHEAEKKQFLEKIANLEKQHEHLSELHEEKESFLSEISELKLQVESQDQAIANFLKVSDDLLEARSNKKNYKERNQREKFCPKIVSIKRGFNSTMIQLENDTLIEVSPFGKDATDLWLTGQAVELQKGDGLVYTLDMTNLDTDNSVAVKIKETL